MTLNWQPVAGWNSSTATYDFLKSMEGFTFVTPVELNPTIEIGFDLVKGGKTAKCSIDWIGV